jgi:small subunit ribosomal protein S17
MESSQYEEKCIMGQLLVRKQKNMAVVAREYPHPVPKYKRYERSKSKLHAYIPGCVDVEEGTDVKIAECRPLSKTVSFVIIEVTNKNGSKD